MIDNASLAGNVCLSASSSCSSASCQLASFTCSFLERAFRLGLLACGSPLSLIAVSFQGPASFNSMRNRRQPGSCYLHVMLRRVEARPNGADHIVIDDNRRPALHLGETLRSDGGYATMVDRVFERLTWFLE